MPNPVAQRGFIDFTAAQRPEVLRVIERLEEFAGHGLDKVKIEFHWEAVAYRAAALARLEHLCDRIVGITIPEGDVDVFVRVAIPALQGIIFSYRIERSDSEYAMVTKTILWLQRNYPV